MSVTGALDLSYNKLTSLSAKRPGLISLVSQVAKAATSGNAEELQKLTTTTPSISGEGNAIGTPYTGGASGTSSGSFSGSSGSSSSQTENAVAVQSPSGFFAYNNYQTANSITSGFKSLPGAILNAFLQLGYNDVQAPKAGASLTSTQKLRYYIMNSTDYQPTLRSSCPFPSLLLGSNDLTGECACARAASFA